MKEKYVSVYEKKWKDLEDNNHIYKKSDVYPREGLEVSKKRIKELSSTKNKIGEVLIAKFEETVVINEKSIIAEEDAEKLDNTEIQEVVAENVKINSEVEE